MPIISMASRLSAGLVVVDPATGIPTDRKDRVHANGLWARFESYRSGHVLATGYALPPSSPFDDWDVSHRYAHQSNFNFVRAGLHRLGALAVCQLIKKAQMEGLL